VIGDSCVVLVDVRDIGTGLAADSFRSDTLEVAEPHVRIEASLFHLAPKLLHGEQLSPDGSRQGLVSNVPLLHPEDGLFDGMWKLSDVELVK
jgi:hypothetical protein